MQECIDCGHECCRWIGFTTTMMSGRSLEFYNARGCKILKTIVEGEDIYRVYIPHVCPHLKEGFGCEIYGIRPLSCIEYEGCYDPLVKDICKLGAENALTS